MDLIRAEELLKTLNNCILNSQSIKPTREMALCMTKMQEAYMWLNVYIQIENQKSKMMQNFSDPGNVSKIITN